MQNKISDSDKGGSVFEQNQISPPYDHRWLPVKNSFHYKNAVYWMWFGSITEIWKCFRGNYYLHFQGRSWYSMKYISVTNFPGTWKAFVTICIFLSPNTLTVGEWKKANNLTKQEALTTKSGVQPEAVTFTSSSSTQWKTMHTQMGIRNPVW